MANRYISNRLKRLRYGNETGIRQNVIKRGRLAQRQKEKQQKQAELKKIISRISSINNINKIKEILNNAPAYLKENTISILKSIQKKQEMLLTMLQAEKQQRTAGKEKWRMRRKKAKNKRDKNKSSVRENEYEKEEGLLSQIIKKVKGGNIYNYDKVIKYINRAGKNTRLKSISVIRRDEIKKEIDKKQQSELAKNIIKKGYTPNVNSFSV